MAYAHFKAVCELHPRTAHNLADRKVDAALADTDAILDATDVSEEELEQFTYQQKVDVALLLGFVARLLKYGTVTQEE